MATSFEFVSRLDRGICVEGDVLGLVLSDTKIGKQPVGRPKVDISAADIRRLYVDEVKPLAKVAKALGVSTLTLRARMDEYEIPVRKRGRPVKGARKIEGASIILDSDYTESEDAQKALAELLAAEAGVDGEVELTA